MDKTILLASFIFPERLDWFVGYLDDKFDIQKEKVFCYENLDDESRLIITFKLVLPSSKRLDIKNLFPNAIMIHKKGDALYTINALNKLIETKSEGTIGNIDYKAVRIDWSEHQNSLILVNDGELSISRIKRVF